MSQKKPQPPDWRTELGSILEGRVRTSRAEQESAQFDAFLRQVATPALQALCTELESHGREAQIREAPAAILLTVRHGDIEEIAFRVLKRPATNGIVPYIEVRLRKGTRPIRMEGFVRSGSPNHTLDDVTQEEIIQAFLKYYRMVLSGEAPPG